MAPKVRDLQRLKQMYDGLTNLSNVAQKNNRSGSYDPYWQGYYSHERHPMLVTTKQWLKKDRYIVLFVNPKEMSWSLPRRESVSKTAAGAIRNTWRNRFRGTYYDEGTLNVTFQTGNIMPGAGIPEELFGFRDTVQQQYSVASRFAPDDQSSRIQFTRELNQRRGMNADAVAAIMRNPPIPMGLRNFYDFLEMVDQPMLSNVTGGENRHIILYRSRVFPMLRLSGYFTGDAITFSESAEGNANKLEWQATFQIYQSSPPWWQSDSLKAMYVDAIRTYGGLSEVYPPGFDAQEFQDWWKENKGEDLSDKNLPYKSVTTKKGKKPGLVDKKGKAKTGKKAGEPKEPPKLITQKRVLDAKKLLNTYKDEGPNVQPGTSAGKSFLQTEYGQELLVAIAGKFDYESKTPATKAEIEDFMANWIRENTPPDVQRNYGTLLQRLENP